jgi:ABC-type transport system involved in multi-copper enzyme maturation permease subunit
MFGPLYYYELVRLARKGRTIVLRCAYALVLLVTLFFAYRNHFPNYDAVGDPFAAEVVKGPYLARLAHDFVLAVLVVQTIALFVLTPTYLAGAVAGERERGTLDLLFTTHLTDREIVFGKLAARVTHVGGIFLAGLPLLAATQLWGGVDFFALLAAFAAAGLNILAVGSVSVHCSTTARTTGEALAAAYVWIVLYLGVLLVACIYLPYPFATTAIGVFEEMPRGPFVALASCAVVNAVVAATAIWLAVTGLRPAVPRDTGRKAATPVTRAPAKVDAEKTAADGAAPRRFTPVGDWPLVWKEVNPIAYPIALRNSSRYLAAFVPAAALLGWLLSLLPNTREPLLLGFLMLVGPGLVWCGTVAFRAVTSVCREREQRTLDGLLTLPVSHAIVLGAKWLGAVLCADVWYVVTVALAFNAGLNATHPLRALLLAAALAAQVALLASLGMRVSVASRTTLRAGVVMAVLVFVFFTGGWVALGIDQGASNAVEFDGAASDSRKGITAVDPGHMRGLFYTIGLNPIGSWVFLGGLQGGDNDTVLDRLFFRDTQYAVAVYGTLIYALAAGVLWLDALRCFRAGSGS